MGSLIIHTAVTCGNKAHIFRKSVRDHRCLCVIRRVLIGNGINDVLPGLHRISVDGRLPKFGKHIFFRCRDNRRFHLICLFPGKINRHGGTVFQDGVLRLLPYLNLYRYGFLCILFYCHFPCNRMGARLIASLMVCRDKFHVFRQCIRDGKLTRIISRILECDPVLQNIPGLLYGLYAASFTVRPYIVAVHA